MSRQRTYTGHSGQMAVMAELLHRQCNVAVPDVDYGTDVFAFHDDREDVARIQVKAARGIRYKKGDGYSARFVIPRRQLDRPDSPRLYYALAVRIDDGWGDFLVIGRERLQELWNGSPSLGKEDATSENLIIYAQFRPSRVICGEVDLSDFRNAWEALPPLRPTSQVSADADTDAAG
jgi:hypothetical protein